MARTKKQTKDTSTPAVEAVTLKGASEMAIPVGLMFMTQPTKDFGQKDGKQTEMVVTPIIIGYNVEVNKDNTMIRVTSDKVTTMIFRATNKKEVEFIEFVKKLVDIIGSKTLERVNSGEANEKQ